MKKLTAKLEKVDKHHIFPRSRDASRKSDKSNIKRVPKSYHQAYHHLFANMTPPEIIEYLQNMWFKRSMFITPESWLKTLSES